MGKFIHVYSGSSGRPRFQRGDHSKDYNPWFPVPKAQERAYRNAVPRLDHRFAGRPLGLAIMIEHGWTISDVQQFVDTWPRARVIHLLTLVDFAGGLLRSCAASVDEVISWTHATYRPDGRSIALRDVYLQNRAEILNHPTPNAEPIGDVSGIRTLYVEATGDWWTGLLACAAGLSLSEATGCQFSQDDRARLRSRAANRDVWLPAYDGPAD